MSSLLSESALKREIEAVKNKVQELRGDIESLSVDVKNVSPGVNLKSGVRSPGNAFAEDADRVCLYVRPDTISTGDFDITIGVGGERLSMKESDFSDTTKFFKIEGGQYVYSADRMKYIECKKKNIT